MMGEKMWKEKKKTREGNEEMRRPQTKRAPMVN